MKNIEKNYFGKGRQVGKLDIVAVTLSLKALQELAHEYNGEMYVSFEIAKMKSPDQYGKTHTVYQVTRTEQPQQAQEPQPKKKSKSKAKKEEVS